MATCSSKRGENHLFFDVGGRMLISRMIDGQFPAYERVIPKGNDKDIEFERERLTSAVKRVALLSNERSRAVKFEISKGKVEVTSSSSEFGEASEETAGRLLRRDRSPSRSTLSTCSTSSALLKPTVVSALAQGRSQPGRDEARRRAGLRLHLRHHADENLTGTIDPQGHAWNILHPRNTNRRASRGRLPFQDRTAMAPSMTTVPTRSRSSKALRRFENGPPCTSARRARQACITSSTKSSTTRSTRRWPDSAIRSTSRFTSTIRLPLSTTAAAFRWTGTQAASRRPKSCSRCSTRAASSTTRATKCRAAFTESASLW